MKKNGYVIANWKMNKTHLAATHFLQELLEKQASFLHHVIICAPFTALERVQQSLLDSTIEWGAQNVHDRPEGPFTGEISAIMLKALGCSHVLIGHSERRQYGHETDDVIAHKIKTTIEHSMTPILCVGESAAAREGGETLSILESQISHALMRIPTGVIEKQPKLIIAYEPLWAIGTGRTPTEEEIQEVHQYCREFLKATYGSWEKAISILYGGSVTAHNSQKIAAIPDVDGVLVGNASLDINIFLSIVTT